MSCWVAGWGAAWAVAADGQWRAGGVVAEDEVVEGGRWCEREVDGEDEEGGVGLSGAGREKRDGRTDVAQRKVSGSRWARVGRGEVDKVLNRGWCAGSEMKSCSQYGSMLCMAC